MINVHKEINIYCFITFYTHLLPYKDKEPHMVTSVTLRCSLKRERLQNKKRLFKSEVFQVSYALTC